MQIRVCDRCLTNVQEATTQSAVRGVTVPPDLPSTNTVSGPIDVNLSIIAQAPMDLCPPCRLSALLEYVAREIVAVQSPEVTKALGQRFSAVLKGKA